jgi:hypothetical protein
MILTKHIAGNIIQIRTPIVDPTNPITTSTDGIKMPTNMVDIIMNIVNGLYFDSGTYGEISE